ncbi:MAG: tetratricopeptide repeat protein [Bryobacteraceae bacterium]|nr:tetratricopeptide repeat protein [Bryobacteraceae bacterium]
MKLLSRFLPNRWLFRQETKAGLSALDSGFFEQAEVCLLSALERAGRFRRKEGPLGRALYHVAVLYAQLRDYEKAERYGRECVRVLEFPLNPAVKLLPDAWELLARIQLERNDFEAAERTVHRSLQSLGHRFGERSGDVAERHWTFARLLFRFSRYHTAVPLYHTALRSYMAIEGAESNRVTDLLLDLGEAQRKAGNCVEAIETLQRALHTLEDQYGASSPQVAPYLHLLGAAYSDCGYRAQAVRCYERALAIHERILPDDHPKVGRVLYRLAEALNGLRQFHPADIAARRAVDILRATGDPALPEATQVLAAIKADRGLDEQADRLFQSAVTMLEESVGHTHLELADYLDRHAAVVWKLGRYEEADAMMARAQEIRKALVPAGV